MEDFNRGNQTYAKKTSPRQPGNIPKGQPSKKLITQIAERTLQQGMTRIRVQVDGMHLSK
jgi:hypothetical protein